MCGNGNSVKTSHGTSYFDNFGVDHISKETDKLIGVKNIKNIYKIQAEDSIMYRYFFIGFINFMLKGKRLTGFTNLFWSNNFKMMIK